VWNIYPTEQCNIVTCAAQNECEDTEDFIYNSCLHDQIQSNLDLYLFVMKQLRESKNVFSDYSSLFDRYFKKEDPAANIFAHSIFERLFLRFLRTQYNNLLRSSNVAVFELNENTIRSVNITMMGTSVSNEDNGNKFDIPLSTETIVSCTDEEFSEFTASVSCALHRMTKSLNRDILIGYLLGKVEQMFELTRKNPIFIRGRRNIAFCYLSHVKHQLRREFVKIQSRRVQFHELVGASGIGKSMAVDSFANIIRAMVPHIPKEDCVYTRANDYWWNGYCGQPIVLYDDFTHAHKLKFDLKLEVISVASGTFRNPPMAFAKDTRFTSCIAFITSNIPICSTTRVAATKAALGRRINSNVYYNINGTEYGSSLFQGTLLNTLVSDRYIFGLFAETVEIYRARNIINFRLVESQLNVDSNESSTSELTSSVAESYSVRNDVDVVSEETDGFGDSEISESAQLNHEDSEEPMLSVPSTLEKQEDDTASEGEEAEIMRAQSSKSFFSFWST
jgi:hypothetical protein